MTPDVLPTGGFLAPTGLVDTTPVVLLECSWNRYQQGGLR
jgi:hypothetical protein